MTTLDIRQQLHRQIDRLPDDTIEQIADFVLFVITRRKIALPYEEWEHYEWRTFSLERFFRDDDEIEYTLEDAQEVYHP